MSIIYGILFIIGLFLSPVLTLAIVLFATGHWVLGIIAIIY